MWLWKSLRDSGQEAKALDETKTLSQSPPSLFDLTSLQREANNRFGFSAKNTVGLAQALYDKHKLITYPRTDSKFLPEDYVATVKETISSLKSLPNYQKYCSEALKLNFISDKHKVFNDKKLVITSQSYPPALLIKSFLSLN